MPSLRCCSILLFFLAFTPALSCAQQSKKLKDLKQVEIIVEDIGQNEKDLGLSTEELKAVVVVALKRDLPNLKIKDDAVSMFYVRVASLSTSCGYVVTAQVNVVRPSAVLRDEDNSEVAHDLMAVWEHGSVLTGSANNMSSKIYEYIREEVTRFAADYYQQNER